MSIATNKGADQPACKSEQHPSVRFFDSRVSTDVKVRLIMLKLECLSVAEEAGLYFTWLA